MNREIRIIIIFFFIGFILSGTFLAYSIFNQKNKLREKTEDLLSKDMEEKVIKIQKYTDKMKEDIDTLQNSEEVKGLLKRKMEFDESILKKNVNERSRVISKEVENYIVLHPEKTLKELQKDKSFGENDFKQHNDFKDIIVQPVGKGYSFAYGKDTLITYFHKDPQRIGYDFDESKNTSPELWTLIKKASDNGSSEGFYYSYDKNNNLLRKYGRFVQVSDSTADGVKLIIGTTAGLTEYMVTKGESEYLDSIAKNAGYSDIVLISPSGQVAFMTQEIDGCFGTNLQWEIKLGKGFSNHYFKVKESKNSSFYGPFIEVYGQVYPIFTLMAPVYDSGEFIGYVAIADETDAIFEITKNVENLKGTGESYLVNKDLLLISPLRDSTYDIMVQSVNTTNVNTCFENAKDSRFNKGFQETDIKTFENYKGEISKGTSFHFSDLNWCLITEISEDELISSSLNKTNNIRSIYFSIVVVIIITLIGVIIGNEDKIFKK